MQQHIYTGITLIGIWGLLASCGSSQVLYDYYTKAPFSGYNTYSWLESTGERPVLIGPLDAHIRENVGQALEKKGLTLTESGGNLLVLYHIGEKAPVYPSRFGYTYWPDHWSYGGYYGGIEQYNYSKGALIIDLIDRRSNQLVWRGSAPGVIRNAKTGNLKAAIDEAIAAIMLNFPPPVEGM